MSDTCRSCDAPIEWAVTTNGKRIPLDPHPTLNGNIELYDGVAHVVPVDLSATTLRYTSHFATCSDPARHRKTGRR